MHFQKTLLFWCATAAATLGLPCAGGARSEVWQDTAGNEFRGEPVELIGPWAFFSTSPTTWRKMPLHLLSPEACVRLEERLHTHPPRADDWTKSKSDFTHDLIGNVLRVDNDKLVPAVLNGRPEPEFYVVLYGSHSEGKAWEMIDAVLPSYENFKRDFPGMVEVLFFGTSEGRLDYTDIAVSKKMPWLIIDFYSRNSLKLLSDMTPESQLGIVVLNREGMFLLAASGDSEQGVKEIMDALGSLLDLMRPENPKSWADRSYYFRTVQPVVYKEGHSDPVLVGNPILASGLRQRAVYRFDATINVTADGGVTSATISPGGDLPQEMVAPVADALRRLVFVPAVENGKFVAGVYNYHFSIPR